MSVEQVTLHAEFTAIPGAADEIETLIQEYAQLVRAEPGNVAFNVYRRVESTDRFFVFEAYRDRAAFEDHIAGESGQIFNERLVPKIVEPASVLSFLTPVATS